MLNPDPIITNNTIGSIGTTVGILQHQYTRYYAPGMDLKKLMGKKIKEARLDRRMSQGELAASCGFYSPDGEPAQGRISHYETGRSPVTLELFEEIARGLGLTPDELWSYGNPHIEERGLSPAEAQIIEEYRLFDHDAKEDLLDEIRQIKKRLDRERRNAKKPSAAAMKSA